MMRLAVLLVAMAVALPVTAEDATGQDSVRPMPRPESAPTVEVPAQVAPPQAVDKTGSVAAPSPATAAPGQRDLLRLDDATYASCLVTLRDLGVVYEEVAAVVGEDDADCGILRPVKVSEIAPGVALIPAAVLRCPTARTLAAWVKDFVLPAATRLDGRGALMAIENGSGYICRRRNNQETGALSEHAFGNAFDVMGFRFAAGPPVIIEPRNAQGSLDEAFQNTVWASACLDFTTVLGPGSNASHDDHLHLDILARNNGYRLCELGGAVEK